MTGYKFLKLDGSTKQVDRELSVLFGLVGVELMNYWLQGMPMIDRFNKDPEVYIFLISTLAGGTGLNLTGANKVVIFGKFTFSSTSPSSPAYLFLQLM
jgi:SNF2 family DNA or RNA helicase